MSNAARRVTLDDCFPMLLDHLSLAEAFRLREALCRRAESSEVSYWACARMGLVRRISLGEVSAKMLSSSSRCLGCGATTRRSLRICDLCADGDDPFVALRGREYAVDANNHACGGRRIRNLIARIRVEMRPVCRTRTGKLLYWKRDMDAFLTSRMRGGGWEGSG